jgi:hypothetical protein
LGGRQGAARAVSSGGHLLAFGPFGFGDHFGGALGVAEGQQVCVLGEAPRDIVVEQNDLSVDDGILFFIAFQRSPNRQFIPIQRRLAASDALNRHTLHTSSAIFACPPGVEPGGFLGEELFA